jgi:DNA polymerase III delta subunit
MVTIIHGENTVQSRNALFALIQSAQEKNQNLVRLDAKRLTIVDLENALGSNSLFAEQKTIIIEELHSLPKSKKQEELIAKVAAADRQEDNATTIILWEKRELTATMLKKFPTAKVQAFKLTSALFKWLDSLSGNRQPQTQKYMLGLLQQAIESDGDMMCFVMLIRQIRYLIQAKEGSLTSGAPFMIAKLNKQTQSFTPEQLLKIHHQLLEMDLRQKTSTSDLGLGRELELLMVEM